MMFVWKNKTRLCIFVSVFSLCMLLLVSDIYYIKLQETRHARSKTLINLSQFLQGDIFMKRLHSKKFATLWKMLTLNVRHYDLCLFVCNMWGMHDLSLLSVNLMSLLRFFHEQLRVGPPNVLLVVVKEARTTI